MLIPSSRSPELEQFQSVVQIRKWNIRLYSHYRRIALYVDSVVNPQQIRAALTGLIGIGRLSVPGDQRELLRIYGARFNAIDGHFDQSRCQEVAERNRCVPLRGNCVRIGGITAPVEAVTPRMLVVRWPFTCIEPVPLVVTTDQGSTGLSSEPFTVCRNATETGS